MSMPAASIHGDASRLAPSLGSDARRQFEAISANATVALFILDERQHCLFMNPAAEALTGYSIAELRDRSFHDVLHHSRPDGSRYPREECPIVRAFPRNSREQGEEVFIRKDGSFYPIAFAASPIRDEAGVIGTIVEIRDISAEKQRERALREETAALEILNRTGMALAAELDLERIVQIVTDAA
ncbi:MAG TPA: PAS domain S-box protein, partial [Propylenella sp.]|nr:PAS domain S-box protein [Propylenella sp.]